MSIFIVVYSDKSWGGGTLQYPTVGSSGYYVDGGTRQVTDEDLNAVAEKGFITSFSYIDPVNARWVNDTGVYEVVLIQTDSPYLLGWNLTTMVGVVPLGFLGLIGVVLVLATIVGVRVVGIGLSETSIASLIQGMAWVSLFLLCSALSVGYILSIPVFGALFYTFLTLVFTVGLVGQMGSSGGSINA